MMICKIIVINIIWDINIIGIRILYLYNNNSHNNFYIFFSVDYILESMLYNGTITKFDIELSIFMF